MSARPATRRKPALRDLTGQPPRAMLTCYDHTAAGLMAEAGVDYLLVGDSAANVVLGHETTVPADQGFLVELCRAVRRGHPHCHLTLDAAFGPHFGAAGARDLVRAFKASGADALKIELTPGQLPLVGRLASVGVPVVAHLGLTPQHVLQTGGYRFRGRTAAEARELAGFAAELRLAGASAFLLEATTAPATAAVIEAVGGGLPVIGCGAGPGCAAYVLVTHDLLGLTPHRARFVPDVPPAGHADVRSAVLHALTAWRAMVEDGGYPAADHCYPMPAAERRRLRGEVPA